MERCSLEAFVTDPIRHFYWDGPLVLWVWSPSLVGIAHIGQFTAADLPLLRVGAALPFHPALERPYDAIIDSSRLTHIDSETFQFLVEHLNSIRGHGPQLIRRLRVVRPGGLTGAAALGLAHEYLAQVIETRFCTSLDDAVADLVGESERAALGDALAHQFAAPTLVERVRVELDASPNLSIAVVASRIDVSVRTLQRALATGSTSYRNEAARARLSRARRLLATTDASLEVIARRAGYQSAISMARRIRDVYNAAPSSLRGKR